jgi:hypothetical protein
VGANISHDALLVAVMKPVGADAVRPSSTVERPSMSLLMLGGISGRSAVGLGVFAVEVIVFVGKGIVLVDTEMLPWRTSPFM